MCLNTDLCFKHSGHNVEFFVFRLCGPNRRRRRRDGAHGDFPVFRLLLVLGLVRSLSIHLSLLSSSLLSVVEASLRTMTMVCCCCCCSICSCGPWPSNSLACGLFAILSLFFWARWPSYEVMCPDSYLAAFLVRSALGASVLGLAAVWLLLWEAGAGGCLVCSALCA